MLSLASLIAFGIPKEFNLSHTKLAPVKAVWSSPFKAKVSAYESVFKEASMKYKVPWRLLVAQDIIESRLNQYATNYNINGSWDRGIAQINSLAHPNISMFQAFNPVFAINWQARQLAKWNGDWWDALAQYNSGQPYSRLYGQEKVQVYYYISKVWHVWKNMENKKV